MAAAGGSAAAAAPADAASPAARRAVDGTAARKRGTGITQTMQELKQQGRGAFIPFLVACDPDPHTSLEALQLLDELGADVIEVGVPSARPSADGPTIQAADARAMRAGVNLEQVLALVRRATARLRAPLLLFTYHAELLAGGGPDSFCCLAGEAGAAGLLVPDLPDEQLPQVQVAAAAHGLELVLLVTPATPTSEDVQRLARMSQGFVYLASVAGPTGMRQSVEPTVASHIKKLHAWTDTPVCVGFGVSGPEQAKQIRAWGAEGVICGSALVRALGESGSREEGLRRMAHLARSLREAVG